MFGVMGGRILDGATGAPAMPRGVFGRKSLGSVLAGALHEDDRSIAGGVVRREHLPPAGPPMPDSRQDGAPPPTPVLGGSMRQPFDYGEALRSMLPEEKKPSTLKQIAGIVGPALMAATGNQAGANAFIQNMAARRQEREKQTRAALATMAKWKHDDWARQNQADLRAANPFTIGRDRLMYDPASGDVQTLYDGPEDFENYAETLGLEPGSEDYFRAVEDYVLRGNGPTAFKYDRDLEVLRHANRTGLEGVRQGNREKLEGIRQGNRVTTRQAPTYRDLNPRSGGGRSQVVEVKTVAEANALKPGTKYRAPDGIVRTR
jgi:hypothetical protein